MIWQNTHTHTQTLYLHTRFHFLLFFPPREEFNFLIEVFYFVRRKLCFALFCLVFVFISAASPSNVSTVFVLAHTRWHNEQTQHPSASFSLFFFFFTAQIFFPPPNVSRRTEQPIWPLALAALSEILSDIERRWGGGGGGGPQEESYSGALVLWGVLRCADWFWRLVARKCWCEYTNIFHKAVTCKNMKPYPRDHARHCLNTFDQRFFHDGTCVTPSRENSFHS